MKFIIIFGPPAVGKMTVAMELAKLTGMKVFHNHMSIDLVLNFFDFEHPSFHELVSDFRTRIFEETAKSDLPGLIFTYVWALDHESDKNFIDKCTNIYSEQGAPSYYVELQASLDERLKRNKSELRLQHKPTKRDCDHSEKQLLEADQKYQLNSNDDFFDYENYLKIDNTELDPKSVAEQICKEFSF